MLDTVERVEVVDRDRHAFDHGERHGLGLHARQQRRMAQRDRPHGQCMQQLLAVPGKALVEIKALPGMPGEAFEVAGQQIAFPASAVRRASARR